MDNQSKKPPAEPEVMPPLLPSREQLRAESNKWLKDNPEEDPLPGWVPLDEPPPPFPIREKLTVFECVMLYTDQNPTEGERLIFRSGDHNEPTPEAANTRLELLGAVGLAEGPIRWENDDREALSNEVFRELARRIKAREVDARLVYFRDRPAEIDYTLCLIGIDAVLDLARERGDYGEEIGKLLLAREAAAAQPAEAGQAAGVAPQDQLAEWIFARRDQVRNCTELRKMAAGDKSLRNFTIQAFRSAFQQVYVTKRGRPPLKGWSLGTPYEERAAKEATHKQVEE